MTKCGAMYHCKSEGGYCLINLEIYGEFPLHMSPVNRAGLVPETEGCESGLANVGLNGWLGLQSLIFVIQ